MINGLIVEKATGSGALSLTMTPTSDFILESVRLHLGAVGASGTLTISVDDADGSAYDVVIKSYDMTSVTDFCYIPERTLNFKLGDKIVVTWANAGGKTYGVKIIGRMV